MKIRLFRSAALMAAASVFAFGLSACSSDEGGTADGIELVKAGQLTVCTHLPYKPFQFTNSEGEVVGFDVGLLDLLADELGVEQKVISVDWNQITSGAVFAADKCDVAMGGSTITDKRKEAVQFSDPYFNATQALLVRKGSGISGLADLEGKQLGVQTETTGKLYAEKRADEFGYEMVVFEDLALETTAVSAGKVAAAVNDNGPLHQYASEHDDIEIATEFDTGERYGFIAKKDDENASKLIERLNKVLADARESGEYDRIFEKWFGQAPGQTGEES